MLDLLQCEDCKKAFNEFIELSNVDKDSTTYKELERYTVFMEMRRMKNQPVSLSTWGNGATVPARPIADPFDSTFTITC